MISMPPLSIIWIFFDGIGTLYTKHSKNKHTKKIKLLLNNIIYFSVYYYNCKRMFGISCNLLGIFKCWV